MKPPISLYQYSYLPKSETFIYRQMQGISRRFDVRLFSLLSENRELFPEFRPVMIPAKSILERLSGKFRETTFTPRRKAFIVNLIRGSKMLYVNFGHMALSMQEMAAEAGIPLVVYFHGVDASAFLRDINYRLEYERSNFHTIFVNSENMKERLLPVMRAGTRIRLIRYGIHPAEFPFRLRQSVPDGAVFLQVSRLDHKKGVEHTLNVFGRYLREIDRTAKLVIAGEGPLRMPLQDLAGKLGIAGNVSFTGAVPFTKVLELMQGADVLLQHSVTAPDGDMEGVPNVIIEAMACGIPVVSTRHSGIPEIVEHGVTGLLVAERDEEEYFRALCSLRSMDVGRFSEEGRKKVEREYQSDFNNNLLCDALNEIAG
jgi:colanic acid/amylovoran biosynthesis glycosyltransferase